MLDYFFQSKHAYQLRYAYEFAFLRPSVHCDSALLFKCPERISIWRRTDWCLRSCLVVLAIRRRHLECNFKTCNIYVFHLKQSTVADGASTLRCRLQCRTDNLCASVPLCTSEVPSDVFTEAERQTVSAAFIILLQESASHSAFSGSGVAAVVSRHGNEHEITACVSRVGWGAVRNGG